MQFFTILYCFLLPFVSNQHPYYVGVTEISYNQATRSMEIAVKLFTDDFEGGLSEYFHHPVNLTEPALHQQSDSLIAHYITKHLLIQSISPVKGGKDNKAASSNLTLSYVGYERESEAIWSYFEVVDLDTPQSITVQNTLLYNHLKKQVNMMHVSVAGKRRSGKLDYPDSTKTFNF